MARIVAADALADQGIMAWEASDADEALEVLARHPRIGLVITDVNMPGKMNGLDLAFRIAEVRPKVDLIVTSGAMKLGYEDIPDRGTFLLKPYATKQMVEIVARKLDGPKG